MKNQTRRTTRTTAGMRRIALLGFSLLSLMFCLQAWGQSYSINWYKVTGGGGTSTNGQYSLNGTIGQPEAGGTMSSGNFSMMGGFWSLVSTVQTPNAPALHIIVNSPGNTVTLYWQNVDGWSLYQNNNINLPAVNPANWSASSGVTTSAGTNYLNLTSSTGMVIYRLQHP
jgi:hypothetical protein